MAQWEAQVVIETGEILVLAPKGFEWGTMDNQPPFAVVKCDKDVIDYCGSNEDQILIDGVLSNPFIEYDDHGDPPTGDPETDLDKVLAITVKSKSKWKIDISKVKPDKDVKKKHFKKNKEDFNHKD